MEEVVISVPHGICSQGGRCDSEAIEAARALHQAFKFRSTLLISQTARSECDMNRSECRKTKFRTRLTETLSSNTILLDVHSYTPGHQMYGQTDHALVLLQNQYPAGTLTYMLQSSGCDAALAKGDSSVNDIVGQAYRKTRAQYLLEFREGQSSQELDNLAEEVVTTLSRLYRLE